MNGKWRVERNRNDKELLPGWVADDGTGTGAWKPTWAEAVRFAVERAEQPDMERVALVEAAFPWCHHLPLRDRSQFATSLVNTGRSGKDDDLLIRRWRAAAAQYANQGLMKARGRAS